MKAHALWVSVLPLAFSAPILVPGGDGFRATPRVTAGSQPCTAVFSFITSSRARHTLKGCDNILLEKYAYLADRWSSLPSFSPSTRGRENPRCKSPILPDHLPTPALRQELAALPGSTLTSTSASTALPAPIAVSLPPSKSQISAYADRMRLEDIIASRDFSVFLDWLSARPIMAWTLIVAVLIIVFFVSAVIVEIAVALRKIITPSDAEKQLPTRSDIEVLGFGEIYLFGPEKRLAATMVIDDREKILPAYTE
ncbi:TPA_exp: Uncharacterized protein A8136_7126 [Trichophyton benhamiae CBS 112371]|uniref:Uncharacterized protein n=1 Tax=Arthroderma benhamiae (strain ATCC MYA-4681 / CBS 112371) TaxID=663331 RepID=D4AT04_ARTBC|nr:uncharacterized protein ARB_07368 [Trichophyton benhamiae CBS 112371]EFE33904.1 hypothetical protein ARB_07368 [Trichophyton benhamiae CBS 112371]DAA76897.1 TPA_exp: Uncharacterized protein A8136_7126 [Trichophyton benhamiae CBS 112371]